MAPIGDEVARWDEQIIDLERRIVEQKSRVAREGGACGSLEVLQFMEQTLTSWREHKRALQHPL